MSTQRAICPVCEREVTLLSGSGEFRCHGPRHDRCHGSRRTLEQAKRYLVSNLTPRQRELMMECWRVGDWRPIEIEFGIDYATEQSEALLKFGVEGLHFYTLNKSYSSMRIVQNLGLRK